MFTLTKFIAAGAIVAAPLVAIAGAAGASADAETLNELAFISVLDDEGIYYASEDAALDLGYATCDAFDSGASFAQLVYAGVNGSDGFYSAGEVGFITGASIGAFCPEYSYLVTGASGTTHA